MPYSASTFEPLISAIVNSIKPRNFFDIGAGAGKYGKMLKDLSSSNMFNCHSTAVEIDEAYINDFKLRDIYDDVIMSDAMNLLSNNLDIKGDLVVLGDFIEHLRKSDGLDLLNFLIYRFNFILLIIPVDMPQGEWEGHAQEAHISLWYESDFKGFKNTSVIKQSFEGMEFLFVLINGVQVKWHDIFKLYLKDGCVYAGYPYKHLAKTQVFN